jgi:hypothetical protein
MTNTKIKNEGLNMMLGGAGEKIHQHYIEVEKQSKDYPIVVVKNDYNSKGGRNTLVDYKFLNMVLSKIKTLPPFWGKVQDTNSLKINIKIAMDINIFYMFDPSNFLRGKLLACRCFVAGIFCACSITIRSATPVWCINVPTASEVLDNRSVALFFFATKLIS